jgi:hypothetical protein
MLKPVLTGREETNHAGGNDIYTKLMKRLTGFCQSEFVTFMTLGAIESSKSSVVDWNDVVCN